MKRPSLFVRIYNKLTLSTQGPSLRMTLFGITFYLINVPPQFAAFSVYCPPRRKYGGNRYR